MSTIYSVSDLIFYDWRCLIWVAQPRLLRRNIFGTLLKSPTSPPLLGGVRGGLGGVRGGLGGVRGGLGGVRGGLTSDF